MATISRPLPGVRPHPVRRNSGAKGVFILLVVALLAVLLAGITALGGGIVAVAGLVMLIVCVALMADYRIAVVSLILVMPVSATFFFPRQIAGVTGLNPVNVLLAGAVMVYVFSRAFSHKRPDTGPVIDKRMLWLYILPILATGMLGARYTGRIFPSYILLEHIHFTNAPGYLRDIVIKPLLYVVYAWLVAAAVRDSKKPERFMWPVAFSALLMCAVVAVGLVFAGGWASAANRQALSATGMHSNEIGPLLVGAIAMMLYGSTGLKGPLRWMMIFTAVACAVAVVLTFSRTAYASLVIVGASYFFGSKAGWRIAIGVALLGILWAILPDEVIRRATLGLGLHGGTENLHDTNDALTAGRVAGIWIPMFGDFLASPLWGNGQSSMLWSPAVRNGSVTILATHPHNAYLKTLTDMGVLGFGLFVAYFVHLARMALAMRKDPRLPPHLQGLCTALLWLLGLLCLQGVTGGAFTPIPSQVIFWAGLGVLYGLHSRLAAEPLPESAAVEAPKGRPLRPGRPGLAPLPARRAAT